MMHTRLFLPLLAALALAPAPHAGASTAVAPLPPGHILSSSGASYGGIIGFNSDGSNYINYTPDDATDPYRPQDKSEHPGISRDGSLMAFDSTRVAIPAGGDNAPHLFVMNSDGTGTRQITFQGTLGDGSPFRDYAPEMSPDGKEVAFISNRGDVRNSVANNRYTGYAGTTDVWVINTDGTNLRQLTFPQAQPNNNGDTYYQTRIGGIAWGPDSHSLAFKGSRLDTLSNQVTTLAVVGLVQDDGTGYGILEHFGYTAGDTLDWSPNGRYIAASYGSGNGYYGKLVILDLTTNTATSLPCCDSNGKTILPFSTSTGALRFSPDSTRLITSTGYNGEYNVQYIYNLDGSNQVALNVPLVRDEPLCWAPGAAIAKPDHLSITPSPVYVPVGGTVHLIPTLYDAQNNVIVHAVRAWNLSERANTFISAVGDLTAFQTAPNGPFTITPDNGGITAAPVFVVVGTPKIIPAVTQLSRDGNGNVIVSLTLTDNGDGSAPQPRLNTATLGSVAASVGTDAIGDPPAPLPFYIVPPGFYSGSFVPGKSLNLTLTFPAAALGPKGTRTVLRLGGDYIIGTFSSSLRVTLP